jgi:hypothetical protein
MKLFSSFASMGSCLGGRKKAASKKAAQQVQVSSGSPGMAESSDEEGISTASSASSYMQQQVFGGIKPPSRRRPIVRSQGPQKHFTKENEAGGDDKLVGVVVTIFGGCSYDPMFREVEPTTVPGERITTYSIGCGDAKLLHDYLVAVMPVPDAWTSLIEDLQSVPPDSVIFNWECCAEVDDSGFPQCSETPADNMTMNLIWLVLSRGFTAMCSDFSLKALIHDWSDEHLGPNPFMKIGETSGQVKLEFQPSDLQNEEVPQQLQVVGQLCNERGSAVVNTLGGTIVYTVNPERSATDIYTLKVLTVASDMDVPEQLLTTVGEGEATKRGAAAHVTLTYANGGQLVTSMAHWIELTKIDTSLEAVMRCAAQEFGELEVDCIYQEMNGLRSETERYDCLQKHSRALIQKSAPTRMKARSKFLASEVLSKY